MRSFLALAVAAVAALVPSLARADQCAINDLKVAESARELLERSTRVLELCEPCRDAAPGRPYEIRKLDVRQGRVFVNGAVKDLAYLYVEQGRGTFRNVGLDVHCGASGVSGYVRDGKPSGPIHAPPPRPTGGGLAGAPRGPVPPTYQPMPAATSVDDLVGTWTVRATVQASTCTARVPALRQTWTIRREQGELQLATSANQLFRGSGKPRPRIFDFAFHPDTSRSGAAVKLTQALRDRFFGSFVYAEPTGDPNDPTCIVHLAISGTRQP